MNHPFIGKTVTVYNSNSSETGWWRGKLLALDETYIYLDCFIIAIAPGMYIDTKVPPKRATH